MLSRHFESEFHCARPIDKITQTCGLGAPAKPANGSERCTKTGFAPRRRVSWTKSARGDLCGSATHAIRPSSLAACLGANGFIRDLIYQTRSEQRGGMAVGDCQR